MATYKQISKYVKEKHDCVVKSCWIAHMKELHGLKPRKAPNRISKNNRKNPCPENKKPLIKEAFQYFNMI